VCTEDFTVLGDILAKLTDETSAVKALLDAGDLTLLSKVRERAAADGINLSACVTQTVQHYALQASDEEWLTLIGMLNSSRDPGGTCLKRAFAYVMHGPS
jgi:post-segregation antitoxin (ccd killing protein)